jgi:ABC-type lipoprotein release transport system permease subunit
VVPAALLVRKQAQLVEGRWPQAGEILAGRLAAAKLGWPQGSLAVGRSVWFEGRTWKVSGTLAARGAVFESELWCPLGDLQQALKRQDLSLVALTLSDVGRAGDVQNFCKERRSLEMEATPEAAYYARLHRDYGPVRMLAWLVVGLVAAAGVFAGLNTMHGAVVGRVRELAMLQTLGFLRRAIALALVQESTLLAAAGALLATGVALAAVNGLAIRFTMAAFALRIDGAAVLIGCGVGMLLGFVGALPPAVRAMRLPVVEALKAI